MCLIIMVRYNLPGLLEIFMFLKHEPAIKYCIWDMVLKYNIFISRFIYQQ